MHAINSRNATIPRVNHFRREDMPLFMRIRREASGVIASEAILLFTAEIYI